MYIRLKFQAQRDNKETKQQNLVFFANHCVCCLRFFMMQHSRNSTSALDEIGWNAFGWNRKPHIKHISVGIGRIEFERALNSFSSFLFFHPKTGFFVKVFSPTFVFLFLLILYTWNLARFFYPIRFFFCHVYSVSPSERAFELKQKLTTKYKQTKNDMKNVSRHPIISRAILCSALLFLPRNHKKYDIVSCCLLLRIAQFCAFKFKRWRRSSKPGSSSNRSRRQ